MPNPLSGTSTVIVNGYRGPVVALTLAEARALMPANPSTPSERSAHAKIVAALSSDPRWREPTT